MSGRPPEGDERAPRGEAPPSGGAGPRGAHARASSGGPPLDAEGRRLADLVLRNVGELVTMTRHAREGLGALADGALAAYEGTIVWVGREADLAGEVGLAAEAVELDAQGACVLPGFVDCHTHAVFAGERAAEYGERLAGVSYLELLQRGGGIRLTVDATRAASEQELAALTARRLDSFLAHGTTTVEVKSGYGLSAADEAKQLRAAAVPHPVRRSLTFCGAHFVPPEFAGRADEYVESVCAEQLPACAPLAEWCDVFCDEGAFTVAQARRVLEAARDHGLGLRLHAEELAHTGAAALGAELGCASADHLILATDGDMAALRAAGTVAVLLPGTSYTLRAGYAPARAFLDAGVTVALASDFNPGSSYCENMQMVISLACQELRLTPDEALWAATAGGAAALRLTGRVGVLAPGAACDLVVLDAATRAELPYHYGVNLVGGVVVGGRPAEVGA